MRTHNVFLLFSVRFFNGSKIHSYLQMFFHRLIPLHCPFDKDKCLQIIQTPIRFYYMKVGDYNVRLNMRKHTVKQFLLKIHFKRFFCKSRWILFLQKLQIRW